MAYRIQSIDPLPLLPNFFPYNKTISNKSLNEKYYYGARKTKKWIPVKIPPYQQLFING